MTKLQTLQCVEVTSQAQANNGTQCFHDPITNSDYLSYENGYVRRAYTRGYTTPRGYKYKNRSIYQLNPTKLTPHNSNYDGSRYYSKERLMVMDPAERMEILANAVANFRIYRAKEIAKFAALAKSRETKRQFHI
jgi:hypothetical protein|tara:strand:- start:207 stop:611 length:405 start_codon:yes stop_codon:yes gene_type:complete